MSWRCCGMTSCTSSLSLSGSGGGVAAPPSLPPVPSNPSAPPEGSSSFVVVTAAAISSCEFSSGILFKDCCGGFVLGRGVAVPVVGVNAICVFPLVFAELAEEETFVENYIVRLRDLMADEVQDEPCFVFAANAEMNPLARVACEFADG
ncbi:unnamed protein product [Closterium sp. NIES-54]